MLSSLFHMAVKLAKDSMAEWLRREIRNLMGSARVGSNPAAVGRQLVLIFVLGERRYTHPNDMFTKMP